MEIIIYAYWSSSRNSGILFLIINVLKVTQVHEVVQNILGLVVGIIVLILIG